MLLFEARTIGTLTWTRLTSGGLVQTGTIEDVASLSGQLVRIPALVAETSFAYVLLNGGELLPDDVTELAPEGLSRLQPLRSLATPANGLTLDAAATLLAARPDATHWLLSDTAFFNDLPDVARTYALPGDYAQRGFVRYGADGLCHRWVHDRLAAAGKLVSVRLCDAPTVAAIVDGRPVECSAGFSRLEGIPSATGSGDIDPSIPIELMAAGWAPDRIAAALAERSGFAALAGRPCSFAEIAAPDGAGSRRASDAIAYAVAKAIGAALASMGGGDVIAFASAAPARHEAFVRGVCGGLAFAGVKLTASARQEPGKWVLSPPDSSMQVVMLEYDRPMALRALIAS